MGYELHVGKNHGPRSDWRKPSSSPGKFAKSVFRYVPERDAHLCSSGRELSYLQAGNEYRSDNAETTRYAVDAPIRLAGVRWNVTMRGSSSTQS
jgi:hypothetical protein